MKELYFILLSPNISQTCHPVNNTSEQIQVLWEPSYYCISVPTYRLTSLQKHKGLKAALLITPNYVVVLLMHSWF